LDKLYLPITKAVSEIGWEGTYYPKCTVTEVPFNAEIKLKYTPKDKVVEFIELEKQMTELITDKIMIIEEVPAIIIDELLKDLNPRSIEVEVFASTRVHNNATARLKRSDSEQGK